MKSPNLTSYNCQFDVVATLQAVFCLRIFNHRLTRAPNYSLSSGGTATCSCAVADGTQAVSNFSEVIPRKFLVPHRTSNALKKYRLEKYSCDTLWDLFLKRNKFADKSMADMYILKNCPDLLILHPSQRVLSLDVDNQESGSRYTLLSSHRIKVGSVDQRSPKHSFPDPEIYLDRLLQTCGELSRSKVPG